MINQIEPWIDEGELIELKRVIESTFVTEAELTEEFEKMTRDLTGSKHAITMTNGTLAIYCALKALRLGPGDEVIVPNMTFIASANAVIMAGAKPVLCDIYSDTFCLNIELAEKLINTKTKAIMPVHLYGQSADMDKVTTLARKYDLFIIEDAAQGVGVEFMNKHVGRFGDIGILSYYGNKTITCGEGGMILTDNDEYAKQCYRLKNHGRDNKGVFIHDYIGYNFSFTEMQAAIGISQMKKLPKIIMKKKEIYKTYTNNFSDLKFLKPIFIDSRTKPVHWFSSFLCKKRKDLEIFLKEKNILTRRFFYPLNKQPCYINSEMIDIGNNKDFLVSKKIYNEGISLPSSYLLSNSEQNYVIDTIREFFDYRH